MKRFKFILLLHVSIVMAMNKDPNSVISGAEIIAAGKIKLESTLEKVKAKHFALSPQGEILHVEQDGNDIILTTTPLAPDTAYYLHYKDVRLELQPGRVLDSWYSEKQLGCIWNPDRTIFRVFAPRATAVTLVLFESVDDSTPREIEMLKDNDGVWEALLPGHYFGQFYGYRVAGPKSPTEMFDSSKIISDPYARAVATQNEYQHRGKTLILDTSDYDWEGDTWLDYKWEDLIIYECHLRDMTAHAGSGVSPELAGSYKGFIQSGINGGLEYIKKLGVNAVEFLPLQDFGNIEIPYGIPANGTVNTWNPYARNHWGYMTSYFFAPESYYASGQTLKSGEVCGATGHQVNEFKDVVKALHRNGIAVIMDVVFNHVSQYDQNCFKYIDKKYYFHLDDKANFCSASGCGNDLNTARPMTRRFIIDCIKFWMTEYHIDGFRFDLATMIDWETIDLITKEARKINPRVILIAEPWGGGQYDPAGFSKHGWAAWNDQFRNGIKGQNPADGHGFIFGKWWDFNNPESIRRYIYANPVEDGGLFAKKQHAVNYLESHDDHTFGDFVRIGLGLTGMHDVVEDVEKNAVVTGRALRTNKLGALILMTSLGPVMMHEGQEFARSKVIAPTMAPDSLVGQIDHNSYNKDNETNWLNFDHAMKNPELLEYYRGLIRLRKASPALRRSSKKDITFLETGNPFAVGCRLNGASAGDNYDYMVLFNAGPEKNAEYKLPSGKWEIVVNQDRAGETALGDVQDKITIEKSSGAVLRLKRL